MDGISQPILQGSRDAERYPESVHLTALGEIVCGYRNADGEESAAPALKGCTDFGRNGTYLVLRQLAQHVSEFWRFVYRASNASGANAKETAEALAAKVVGRWPDGTPLPPYTSRDDNEFGFAEDPHGYGCPLGSHIRRANPRDAFINTNLPAANPLTLNRHRVLRRGRSYGAKADDPLHATGGRGLFFMALNSDIERQFEFIQQNWINNPAFSGLRDERDPLVGDHDAGGGCPGFTIPALPAPARVVGLRRFVTVKGGQYFFLPGFKALNYLAKGDHAGP
jgi:Dyp-type peroxidase family